MKLQINSKEALERLIGDDKELEVTIKNTILNEISGKYLKAIAHDDIMDKVRLSVYNALRETDYGGFIEEATYCKIKETTKLKELVAKCVSNAIQVLIAEEINERMSGIMETVRAELDRALAVTIGQVSQAAINRMVNERLRKMIDNTEL